MLLQPSCAVDIQACGECYLVTPIFLQGTSLPQWKDSAAAGLWGPPSRYSAHLYLPQPSRAVDNCIRELQPRQGRRQNSRVIGCPFKNFKSALRQFACLHRWGKFLQLGSHLGKKWGPDSVLEPGKWTEDTSNPVSTSACELCKGLYLVSWLLSSPIFKVRF